MEKIRLDQEIIKKYLRTDQDFSNIEDFCQFLVDNKGRVGIKTGMKKMLVKEVFKDDKAERLEAQERMFDENIAWIREKCCFGEENTGAEQERKDDSASEIWPEDDFEKVRAEYEKKEYKQVKQLEDGEMDYSDGIVLHEGGVITQQNNKQIFLYKEGVELDLSKILIVAAEGTRVLARGFLVSDPDDPTAYTIVFNDRTGIDYKLFEGIRQARFVVYTKQGQSYSRTFEMEYKPFAIEKERPLCIDFGTSNTSAGSYGILDRKKDEAEIVRFIDVTVVPNNTKAVLLPTVVYVDDCSDENHIKYLFGYEARKKLEEEHYESKASVYYEIKRWMSSADEKEEIRDNDNHKACPLKKEIIKAYIDYVIENAEQYFGTKFEKIHFSAPVKQKEQFIRILRELYRGEKQVLAIEESIDEGIAIVYNQIINLMYTGKGEENQKKSIMIMDCGGGTTDLASCEYEYRTTDIGTELRLNTCFENGNVNFGGNNITYRIMQLLKIKVAAALSEGIIDSNGEAIRLIDKSENEILGLVEINMKKDPYDSDQANDDIYAGFLENYKRAERIVPTQYVENKKYRGVESLKKIKRNFYYLWNQAEQIKIEFYKTERVLMDFEDVDEDTIINIRSQDNYYLYIADPGNANSLRREDKPFDKVSITIKEINRVICGDIYSLLVGLFQNGELTSKKIKVDEFHYYKLSGQSCKISLFSELIKEYIPGRKFRPVFKYGGTMEKKSSEDLKLDCVLGCINYVKDQLRPEMKVISIPGLPEIIYNISLKGTHDQDKKLFDCKNPNQIRMEVSDKNTREYPLVISGKDHTKEREFIFGLRNPNEGGIRDTWQTTEEIRKKLADTCVVSSEGLDEFIDELKKAVNCKQEKVNIVFVVPARQGYGVYIGQIQAESTEDGSNYMLLKYEYENFEDSSKTFFDGRR